MLVCQCITQNPKPPLKSPAKCALLPTSSRKTSGPTSRTEHPGALDDLAMVGSMGVPAFGS